MIFGSRLIDLLKRVDALLGRSLARAFCRPGRALPANADDVLVVRLWGMGNLVLLAPLLAAQSCRRVRLLTLQRNAQMARRLMPRVDLLLLPDPILPGFALAVARLVLLLRRDPPQVIVEAETFLSLPALLVRTASGACVVGLDTPGQGRGPLLDRPVRYDPTRHVALSYAALFEAARLSPAPPGRAVPAHPQPLECRALRSRLGLGRTGPLILLHPGSGDHFPGRRWPPERFSALAALLAASGATVAITGTDSEAALARQVVAASGFACHSLAGLLSDEDLITLLAGCDLLVCNDTGPLHLADALDTPVVGLFGPNTPHRYGPRGRRSVGLFADLPCSPCLDDRMAKRSACRTYACMDALSVSAVASACARVLNPEPKEQTVAVPA